MFLNINQNWPKEGAKKNDNFSYFAKHRLIKENVLLQPPFSPKIVVFQLWFFLKPKTLMLNKNITSNQEIAKIRKKRFETKKQDKKPKKEKILMKKNVAIEYFDVVPFMKQKQRRKKRKERDKNKEPKESKKERQKGRKKDKNKRETEKEKLKKGEAKKG